MKSLHSLDGHIVKDGSGREFAVFIPRWWQVWRWYSWWTWRGAKGSIVVTVLVTVRTVQVKP